jgi:hypothetical protein
MSDRRAIHPYVPRKGFTQRRDIYSRGVVLFEVAVWKRLSKTLLEKLGTPLDDIELSDIRGFPAEIWKMARWPGWDIISGGYNDVSIRRFWSAA